MFGATLRQFAADTVPVDTVLEAAGHQAELAAALVLVPRRVPPFRCMREEPSLSTLTLHDQ